MATLGRFVRSPVPHSVQYRSSASDGAEQEGHGGPRNAPPQREQKFAPAGFSGYWHFGHTTPVAGVIRSASRPIWR